MKQHITTALLVALMLVMLVPDNISPAYAQSSGGVRRQLKAKRQELTHQQSRLDVLNERERDLARQLNDTQYNLQESRTDFNNTVSRLQNAQKRHEDLQEKLSIATEQYRRDQRILGKRLREIYMQGDMGYLVVLLGARSFIEFVDHVHYLSIIIARDYKLLLEVRQLKSELAEQTQAAQELVAEMKRLRSAQEARVAELSEIERHRRQLLDEVTDQRKAVARYVAELEGSTQSLENKLRNTITSRQSSVRATIPQSRRTWGTGRYVNPAEGPITSPYGYRVHPIFGTMRFHSGIDIGAYYGSSILAADGGIVIEAGWIGGYGNTVMIDHGGGYTTLYGHCSQLYVHNGQIVNKGEPIAAVGSTGNSTGPHLHFEVRINGNPADPLGFI